MLATRLGAALSLAMPCIVAMLCVNVFGAPNTLTNKALVPQLEIKELSDVSLATNNMFGNITINVQSVAFAGALGQQTCKNIVPIQASASQLDCTTISTSKNSKQKNDDGNQVVLCSTTSVCVVDNNIAGVQKVLMRFPVAFQKMKWTVQPGAAWYGIQTVVYDTLSSRSSTKILSGTEIEPTELNFGVIRGKLIDNMNETKSIPDFGLQLTWRGSTVQESNEGPPTANHYVGFTFSVSENVFVVELRQRKDLLAKATAVLTLFLSVMSAMRMLKTTGQLGLDKCLECCAIRYQRQVPADVLRRKKVLEEHLLTDKGRRRLSSSRNLLTGVDFAKDREGGSGRTIPKRHDREWKTNPLQMGESNAVTTVLEVEMTELGKISRQKNKKAVTTGEVKTETIKRETIELRREMKREMAELRRQNVLQKEKLEQNEQKIQELEKRLELQNQQMELQIERTLQRAMRKFKQHNM